MHSTGHAGLVNLHFLFLEREVHEEIENHGITRPQWAEGDLHNE
jgi:hypothetical protein